MDFGTVVVSVLAIVFVFGIPLSAIIMKSSVGQAIADRIRSRGRSGSDSELLDRMRELEEQITRLTKAESLVRQVSAEEIQQLKRRVPLSEGTVTILFSDIEDFTRFTEQSDEAALGILQLHNKMIRDQLNRFDGVEVKSWADGFMVAFSSARKALLCAVEIQEAFRAYNTSHDEPIRVRVGINSGEPIKEGDDFIGRAVNLAARIADYGRGGEIWVSDTVRNLVGTVQGFQFIDRGRRKLQGFSEPQQLYEMVRIEALESPERRELEARLKELEAKVKGELADT